MCRVLLYWIGIIVLSLPTYVYGQDCDCDILTLKVSKLTTKADRLSDEKKRLKEENEELIANCDCNGGGGDCTEQLAGLRRQLEECQENGSGGDATLKRQLSNCKRELQRMHEGSTRVNDCENKLAEIESDYISLKREVEGLQSQNREYLDKLTKCTRAHDDHSNEWGELVDILERRVSEWERKAKKLEIELAESKNKLKVCEKQHKYTKLLENTMASDISMYYFRKGKNTGKNAHRHIHIKHNTEIKSKECPKIYISYSPYLWTEELLYRDAQAKSFQFVLKAGSESKNSSSIELRNANHKGKKEVSIDLPMGFQGDVKFSILYKNEAGEEKTLPITYPFKLY